MNISLLKKKYFKKEPATLKRQVSDNPNQVEKWDELWITWTDKQGYHIKKKGKKRYKSVKNLLAPHIANASVLDVGCGIGYMAEDLLDTSLKEYLGFDYSSDAIEIARNHITDARFTFIRDSISEFDVRQQKFDVVLLVDFLEHQYIDVATSIIHSYINSCNIMIICTPYKDSTPSVNHITEYDKDFFKQIFAPYNGDLSIKIIDKQELLVTFVWKKHVPLFRK